ncbi:RNA deprotection pyrophosphohydrolase [Alkalicoccus luteus]|uniref:Nucleoside triphosphatase YtkD n=1 Tax=Alkalicoccus luteus TaxID=1237094 RepID=A0A969PP06_9BACI|nr:nucleoside triphosphatase YtkD [Alkalicoccus luteus]NJP36915.1 nucleoside triphosphatase YtkD [Alkalicoccus luteus]
MSEHVFKDFYRNTVTYSTEKDPFSNDPKHVWVVCRYRESWLLTRHPSRGIEFPGGKVEKGESADEAAVREVHEETGGHVSTLYYVGQYMVEGRAETVIKNVYFAEVDRLEKKDSYFETEGPLLLERLPHQPKKKKNYSFIMKDDVLPLSMKEIEARFLNTASS